MNAAQQTINNSTHKTNYHNDDHRMQSWAMSMAAAH